MSASSTLPFGAAGVAVVAVTVLCVLAGALLALLRAARGPSVFDRALGLDVLVAVTVVGLGVEAAVTGRTTTLPVLVVLAVVGFSGSVAVARFGARSDGGAPGDDRGDDLDDDVDDDAVGHGAVGDGTRAGSGPAGRPSPDGRRADGAEREGRP